MSSEWQPTTLGAICSAQGGAIQTGPFGSQLHTSDYKEIGVPVVMPTNIGDGGIAVEGIARIGQEDVERLQQHKLQLNDIVFSRRGDVTKNALIRAHETGWLCGTGCLKVRLGDQSIADAKYISYCLRQPDTKEWLIRHAVGATMPNLNTGILSAVPIILPPLSVQLKVAEILGVLDDRITLLRETNATLEAIAQALFKSWFVDFDPVHAKAEGRARQDGERSGQPRMPQASDLPRPGAEAGAEAQGQPEGAIQGSMSAAEGRMPKAAMDATTAALFPDSFEESELGLVPKGWAIAKFGDFINRLSVGQKYDQKSAFPDGAVPVLDQGKSGIIGYHNDSPGVRASLEAPVVVFANHTCYMRLITFDFSAIQNVLPFNGRGVDTVWAFYATKDRVKFSEYKGHWPDFAIEKSVLPPAALTYVFRDAVDPVIRKIRFNELQAQTLTQLRDTLLPRLISGQLRLPEAEALLEDSL